MAATVPLSDAVQLGGDEHFECMKAMLQAQGHELYTQTWSDQPPLFTEILASIYRVFGNSFLALRLTTLCFAGLLIYTLVRFVHAASGVIASLVAFVAFACSPMTQILSVSVMQEVPAMATGIASLWLMRSAANSTLAGPALSAGFLMAAALLIKLTAVIVLPAILTAAWLCAEPSLRSRKRLVRNLLLFAAGGSTWLMLGLLLWPHADQGTMVWAHIGAKVREAALVMLPNRVFSLALFLGHSEVIIPVVAALLLSASNWTREQIMLPLVWLVTALLFHWEHVPFWSFYYLHFSIPLAWLCGSGLGRVVEIVDGLARLGQAPANVLRLCIWLTIGAAMAGFLLVQGGVRFASKLAMLRSMPRLSQIEMVKQMQARGDGARWIYTRAGMLAFAAGIPIPPPLAVISFKREVWDDLDDRKIVAHLMAFKPDLLLLRERNDFGEAWRSIEDNYELVFIEDNLSLYTRRTRPATLPR